MFDQLSRDVTHAWRSIQRAPVLATVVVLSLGVGIGVNTVVFSWIQALVIHPIPGVSDASSFLLVEARTETGLRPGVSWLEYQDLKQRLRALSDLMAFRMVPLNVGEASRTERAYGLLVSGDYFSGLRLRPAIGRFLGADDVSRPGGEAVVVLSYDYWQTRFAGSPGVLTQTLRVNDRDLAIVGVTPEGFQGTVIALQFDLWLPATLAPTVLAGSRELEDRSLRGYSLMGRLAPGATLGQAQLEASEAMRELARLYPENNAAVQAEILPFWRAWRGPPALLLQGLALLQTLMLLLLLAVCGNTANLVLARATSRQREMGVRLAVGAGWWRILRLMLAEHLIMGLLAAALGAVFAFWGTTALRAVPLLTMQFPVRIQTSLDGLSLAFAVVLGILSAALFGAAPAAQLARVDPQTILKSGTAAPRGVLGRLLMAAEVALALVVLLAAGLFFQSMRQTWQTDPGFRTAGLLLVGYDLTGRDIDAARARGFAADLLERLTALPDVEAAAIATSVPLDIHGLPQRSFTLEGRARTDGAVDRVLTNTVTPGYFSAMGLALVAGRDFSNLRETSRSPEAVVNEEFVRRYIDPGEALGRQVGIGSQQYAITGVVRNSLYESFSEPPTPIVYMSYRDRPSNAGEIHLRTRVGAETLLAPAIRRAVREIDAALPVYNVRTMAQHVDMSLALRKIPARMFLFLGPLILGLASIGIYAVVAYNVAHRTAEVGVRIALGATATRVVGQIVRESLVVIVAGGVAGWLLVAFFHTHLIRSRLDPTVFAGVPVLLLGVATLACWLPARRAARVDPMVALRSD